MKKNVVIGFNTYFDLIRFLSTTAMDSDDLSPDHPSRVSYGPLKQLREVEIHVVEEEKEIK